MALERYRGHLKKNNNGVLKMPLWESQLKLLGKVLRQIKKSHSTDLRGGIEGIHSTG